MAWRNIQREAVFICYPSSDIHIPDAMTVATDTSKSFLEMSSLLTARPHWRRPSSEAEPSGWSVVKLSKRAAMTLRRTFWKQGSSSILLQLQVFGRIQNNSLTTLRQWKLLLFFLPLQQERCYRRPVLSELWTRQLLCSCAQKGPWLSITLFARYSVHQDGGGRGFGLLCVEYIPLTKGHEDPWRVERTSLWQKSSLCLCETCYCIPPSPMPNLDISLPSLNVGGVFFLSTAPTTCIPFFLFQTKLYSHRW